MAPANQKTLVTIRVSPRIADEVRSIAERDDESQSTVIRRLLKRGLEQERTLTEFPKPPAVNGGSQVPTFSDGGSRACCEGGEVLLRCRLCRQSPTYWAHQEVKPCSTN